MANAPRTPQQWFDTSCFANPASFQFGNYKYRQRPAVRRFQHRHVALEADGHRQGVAGGAVRRLQRLQPRPLRQSGAAGLGTANTGLTFGTTAFGSISAVRLPPREAQFGVRFLF